MSTDHNFWAERRAEADSNRGPFAYLPNALPLGQTVSHARVALEAAKFSANSGPIPTKAWGSLAATKSAGDRFLATTSTLRRQTTTQLINARKTYQEQNNKQTQKKEDRIWNQLLCYRLLRPVFTAAENKNLKSVVVLSFAEASFHSSWKQDRTQNSQAYAQSQSLWSSCLPALVLSVMLSLWGEASSTEQRQAILEQWHAVQTEYRFWSLPILSDMKRKWDEIISDGRHFTLLYI